MQQSPPVAHAYILHSVEMPVCVGEGVTAAPLALVADGKVDARDEGVLLEKFAAAGDGLARV